MAKRKRDPVYLVIIALGIGVGFSAGTASEHVVWGLIGGFCLGLIGCLVYHLIKRAKKPKKSKNGRSKYRM